MGQEIMVGMGEFAVSHNDDTITALGLGSCIGVAVYDETKGIGGLAHVMLPSSKECSNMSEPNKFADIAIPAMIREIVSRGADRKSLKAKIAGGAHMFLSIMDEDTMNVGKRNAEAVIAALQKEAIPVVAKDIAGNLGRTVRLELGGRRFVIKTKDGTKEL